jgi:hypothetical protein
MIHPVTNEPEHKRSFIPSKWERKRVSLFLSNSVINVGVTLCAVDCCCYVLQNSLRYLLTVSSKTFTDDFGINLTDFHIRHAVIVDVLKL